MQKDIYIVGNLYRDGKLLNTAGTIFDCPEAAEKYASECSIRSRVPHFVLAAVTKVVPPEPVCLKVPLKPHFLEVG